MKRIFVAPMAGGPSSPQLVKAAAAADALGFLATGGMDCALVEKQLQDLRGVIYGVNLFAKQAPLKSLAPVRQLAARLGKALPRVDLTNGWDKKFALMLKYRPKIVSVTFGSFTAEEIAALHAQGIRAWVGVAAVRDAVYAAQLGADALVVQGAAAGGHRYTWQVEQEPDAHDLESLVRECAQRVDVPLVAAGGIATAPDVDRALSWPGVYAVAAGSVFLLAQEAGTSPANRALLQAGGHTVVSRAFSGRYARGIETAFTQANPDLPPMYPYLRPLTPTNPYCLVGNALDRGLVKSAPAAKILAALRGQ